MEESEIKLISEQIGRMNDALAARIERLEAKLEHTSDLNNEKNRAVKDDLEEIKRALLDHEGRIRSAGDGITQFKTISGLASGGSALMSLVAVLKTFLP
jgi:hypothetical protein